MNLMQILKISGKYAALLQHEGAKPQKYDTGLNVNPGDSCIFDHCLWMCEEITSTAHSQPEKAIRWLCFIQGVLWSSGILDVDSMREDIRLALK